MKSEKMSKLTLLLIILTIFVLLIFKPSLNDVENLIDFRTLVVLTTFMAIQSYWSFSGTANYIASAFSKLGGSFFLLSAALLASVIMNDAAAILLTPLSMISFNDARFISLLAASINVGSSITPFGNPQNMIIWTYYKVPIDEFILNQLLWTLPLLLIIAAAGRGRVKSEEININKVDLVVSMLLLVSTVVMVELKLELMALLSSLLAFTLRFKTVPKVDYELLIQLILMFISFGIIREHYKFFLDGLELLLSSIALSQLISNVPATLILLGSNWKILAIGVNVGGLGSPIGSLANLIVLRISRTDLRIFLKYNFIILAVATVISTLIVYFNL